MIYTITLWAEDLNPYKPNREVSKFLIDCEHVRLHADGYTIDTPESRLTFPNNRVTVTEGDLTWRKSLILSDLGGGARRAL